jgi:hypothetical protein
MVDQTIFHFYLAIILEHKDYFPIFHFPFSINFTPPLQPASLSQPENTHTPAHEFSRLAFQAYHPVEPGRLPEK